MLRCSHTNPNVTKKTRVLDWTQQPRLRFRWDPRVRGAPCPRQLPTWYFTLECENVPPPLPSRAWKGHSCLISPRGAALPALVWSVKGLGNYGQNWSLFSQGSNAHISSCSLSPCPSSCPRVPPPQNVELSPELNRFNVLSVLCAQWVVILLLSPT